MLPTTQLGLPSVHLPPTQPPNLSFVDAPKGIVQEVKYEEEGGHLGRKGLEEKRNKSLRHDRRIISDEHQQRCREIRTQKCRSYSSADAVVKEIRWRILKKMSLQVLLPAKFNEFCLVLGVKEMCCLEPEKKILEKAFRKKALKCHPDKVFTHCFKFLCKILEQQKSRQGEFVHLNTVFKPNLNSGFREAILLSSRS